MLHPEVRVSVTINVARTEDEAERQARGEDVLAEKTEAEEATSPPKNCSRKAPARRKKKAKRPRPNRSSPFHTKAAVRKAAAFLFRLKLEMLVPQRVFQFAFLGIVAAREFEIPVPHEHEGAEDHVYHRAVVRKRCQHGIE